MQTRFKSAPKILERNSAETNGNFNSRKSCLYYSRLSLWSTPRLMEHSVILNQVMYLQSEIFRFFKDSMERLKESLVSAHVNVVRGSYYSYIKAYHHDKKHLWVLWVIPILIQQIIKYTKIQNHIQYKM